MGYKSIKLRFSLGDLIIKLKHLNFKQMDQIPEVYIYNALYAKLDNNTRIEQARFYEEKF